MKQYQFITDVMFVNKETGLKEKRKKGYILELPEQEAMVYMQMAILTPYKEPKKPTTIPEIKASLDVLEIQYTQSMKKKELEALLEEAK